MIQLYRFGWKNNERRAQLYGRTCRMICRGTMNSCLLEFENGERVVTSRNAIRKSPAERAPLVGREGEEETRK